MTNHKPKRADMDVRSSEDREPAEPARVTGTTLRVDTAAVAEAMGPVLGESVMGLLGGAE